MAGAAGLWCVFSVSCVEMDSCQTSGTVDVINSQTRLNACFEIQMLWIITFGYNWS